MNQEITQQFKFDGQPVRCIEEKNEAFFAGNDVASALGYAVPKDAIKDHCKGAVKRRLLTNGGMQEMTVIPERDVYRLIMRSKLPAAERFEEWVVSEVLPAIRKTGGFSVHNAPAAIQVPTTLREALMLALEQTEKLEAAQAQLTEAAPKLEVYEAAINSDGLFTFGQVAKTLTHLGMGQNQFVDRLLSEGIIFRRKSNGELIPKQDHVSAGRFKCVEKSYSHPHSGEARCAVTTRITPRGVAWLALRLKDGHQTQLSL